MRTTCSIGFRVSIKWSSHGHTWRDTGVPLKCLKRTAQSSAFSLAKMKTLQNFRVTMDDKMVEQILLGECMTPCLNLFYGLYPKFIVWGHLQHYQNPIIMDCLHRRPVNEFYLGLFKNNLIGPNLLEVGLTLANGNKKRPCFSSQWEYIVSMRKIASLILFGTMMMRFVFSVVSWNILVCIWVFHKAKLWHNHQIVKHVLEQWEI